MAVRRGVQFLATDIWDTPDDGKRYEVIDGELYVTPLPPLKHQSVLGQLLVSIGERIYGEHLGNVVMAVAVVLDDKTAVQPDLVYVSQRRSELISERGLEGPPDLVVEVLSPETRTRDRGVKMQRYARAGIPHYWILDPETESLEVYGLVGTVYELPMIYEGGDVFRPELFPGLEIPIDDLWR
jgi:Uma2 family endonuclease